MKIRNKKIQPVLDEFKQWCKTEQPKTPPESSLGKAFTYSLNQWDKLIRFLKNAQITPTNNLTENAIRPFVIGRKNWLINGSPEGAEASCGLISLIETAKLHKLNPYFYLNYVFTEIPKKNITSDDLSDLLPMNIDRKKLKVFTANQIPNLSD